VAEPTWVSFWGKKPSCFWDVFLDQLQWFPNQRGKKKLGKVSSRKKKDVRLGSMITIFAGIYLLSFLGG
jgi:hypothetical protein